MVLLASHQIKLQEQYMPRTYTYYNTMREKCPARFFRLKTLKEMTQDYQDLGQQAFLELNKDRPINDHTRYL